MFYPAPAADWRPIARLLPALAAGLLYSAAAAQTLTPEQHPPAPAPALPELQAPVKQWTAVAASDIVDIDEATLLAQAQLLNRLLDRSVMHNDTAGIRVLLPVYRRLPESQRDDILLLLAQSKLAMEAGRFNQAVADLRHILARRPELAVVRLHLAMALFFDRQDTAARDQFEKLLAEADLPATEKQLIARFRHQLQQRHRWQFSGTANYVHEPNINQAPLTRRQGALNTEAEAETANGLAYHFGLSKDWALPQGWLAKLSADVDGRHYFSHRQYNDVSATAAVGIGYHNSRFEAALMPFAGRRWWRGDREHDLKLYSESFGASLNLNTRLNHHWRLNQYVRVEKIRHARRFRFDGIRRQSGHTAIYQANPRQAWFAGIDYRHDSLHDTDNSSHQWTGSVGWIQEWPRGLSTRSRLAQSRQKHHAPMPWPIGRIRQDRSTLLQLSVWHRNLHFWGITPRLSWQHTRNRSNVFLYDYRKHNVFVEFSKTF